MIYIHNKKSATIEWTICTRRIKKGNTKFVALCECGHFIILY